MEMNFEDLRQSDEWSKYISQLGWQVENLGKAKIFVRKLPLIGSVAKIQRPREIPSVEEIDEIAKKHRELFVKLEPSQLFSSSALQHLASGFEKDNWPLLPSKTIWVDLTPTEEEIFNCFSKDARYSVRRAERNGISAQLSAPSAQQIGKFYELFKETGRRKKFWVPPFADLKAKAEAFKNESVLLLAYHQTEPIAGALILFHDNVAYYHHAASNLSGRKLLAPYLIVWEAINLAKKRGCHTLDLEGIYDPRYKIYRRWKNISIFKKKFGGKEVEYPGSFIRYYNPIVKLIFEIASWIT